MTHTEQALNILRDARATLERTRGEEHEAIEAALEKVREAEAMLEGVLRG